MDLDHERLDVYHLALDFLVLASEVIDLSEQFSRASLSIVLNLAEGAGKRTRHPMESPPSWHGHGLGLGLGLGHAYGRT